MALAVPDAARRKSANPEHMFHKAGSAPVWRRDWPMKRRFRSQKAPEHLQAELVHLPSDSEHLQRELGHLETELVHFGGELGSIEGAGIHSQGVLVHLPGELVHSRGVLEHLAGDREHLRGVLVMSGGVLVFSKGYPITANDCALGSKEVFGWKSPEPVPSRRLPGNAHSVRIADSVSHFWR